MTLIERFFEKVDTSGECWPWLGYIGENGYGRLWLEGTNDSAHRLSYRLAHGELPDDAQIDHLCRNRRCVRPSHLEAVTCRENLLRSPLTLASRNSEKTHCPQGHPYSGTNLHVKRGGGRSCRACARAYARRKRIEKLTQGATA